MPVQKNEEVLSEVDQAILEEDDENEIVMMSDHELVKVCEEEASKGYGGNDEDNSEVNNALDYYFSRRPGITKAQAKDLNASRYVSPDVMNSVESTLAEIMPTFSSDQVAFYPPTEERDEESARDETDVMNHLFMDEYDGYTLLQTAIKDALINNNCTVKVFWDERKTVTYEDHKGLNELAVLMVMEPTEANQEVDIIGSETFESVVKQAHPETNEALDLIVEVYDLKIRRTTVAGRPVIESLAPEEVIVCGDHRSPMLHTARFAAQEGIDTASSLIAQGFDPDVVALLPPYTTSETDYARSRTTEDTDYQSADDSTRLIRYLECYVEVDFDGDGIAELRKVVISNSHLLSNTEVDTSALVGGTAILMPHKYRGISLYERQRQVQDVKTFITRAIIDGTRLAANPRIGAVKGEVNLDDLLTSRTGGVVRLESANGVVPMPNPEIPQSAYQLLGLMDQDRSQSGGSAVNSSAQAKLVGGDSAHGVERVMSAMELANALISKTLGETLVRGIFIELHNIVRKNISGMLRVKVKGRWIETTPSNWKKRTAVSIIVGSSHAERQRKSAFMSNVVTMQEKLIAAGSTLTNEKKGYTAITDMIALGGIKNPDRYFTDPDSPEGQKEKEASSAQQQEQKQKNDQLQAAMAKAQNDIAQAEMIKSQADIQANYVKLENEKLKNEVVLLKELATAKQKNLDLEFKYAQLESNEAVALTGLQLEHERQSRGIYQANADAVEDTIEDNTDDPLITDQSIDSSNPKPEDSPT